MKQARRRTPVEPERVTAREFIEVWQSSSSIAEVSKKTGIRKKAVHVRAYRYRQVGIPLKVFPPVELPDWDQLAEYARSLLPKGADATGVGRRDEDDEEVVDPSHIEGEEAAPPAGEE